jgi:PmbA protein
METLPQNSNRSVTESTNELYSIMEQVLEYALQEGATQAAVAANHDSGYSVDVRMGEVETVAFSEDKSVSFTVYLNKQKGSASSTDTSERSLRAMVKAACEIAKVSAEDPCFGLADKELLTNQYPELDLYHPWEIYPEEAIEKALACEQVALASDKRITNSDGASLSTYNFLHGYANSSGAHGLVKSSKHSISCSLIASQEETMQRDYDYTSARYAVALQDINSLARSAAQRTLSRLGSRKISTQKAPIIFSSRLSTGLLSNFIGAISGSNLYCKNSFLLDSIGMQLFPKGTRIYEVPHIPRALGSVPFDGEGVPTRNNVFVEDGVIQQYVLGSYSARRLGLKTTANSGGVFNLTIDPTCGGLDEMIKSMGKGLLVTELMGHGVNGLTGDYSRGAAGFWIENGEIQFPVEEITIAGNLKDMYRNITAVGKDINPNIATRCGSILIEEMMIAGN